MLKSKYTYTPEIFLATNTTGQPDYNFNAVPCLKELPQSMWLYINPVHANVPFP